MLSTENIFIKSTKHDDAYIYHRGTVIISAETILPPNVPDDKLRMYLRRAIWSHVYEDLREPICELVRTSRHGHEKTATEINHVIDVGSKLTRLLELK